MAWIDPAQPAELLQLALAGRADAAGGYRDYLSMVAAGAPEGGDAEHLAWVHVVLKCFETFRILCAAAWPTRCARCRPRKNIPAARPDAPGPARSGRYRR